MGTLAEDNDEWRPLDANIVPNHWYVAATRSALDSAKDRPLRFELGARSFVLFQTASGDVGCLEDLCCHRGVPLSIGSVRGECIACAYHGWEFDKGGVCVRIPSNLPGGRIPRRAHISAYPVIRRGSYCWVWIGSERPGPFPDELDTEDRFAGNHQIRQIHIVIEAAWNVALEAAVATASHVTPRLLRLPATVSTSGLTAVVEVTDQSRGFAWTVRPAAQGGARQQCAEVALRAREFKAEFIFPNTLRVSWGVAAPEEPIAKVQHFVPTGARSTRLGVEVVYPRDVAGSAGEGEASSPSVDNIREVIPGGSERDVRLTELMSGRTAAPRALPRVAADYIVERYWEYRTDAGRGQRLREWYGLGHRYTVRMTE